MTLGKRIIERIQAMGLTQTELARRADVSQPTIAHLIAGRTYGSPHLHRIARALETTPAYLTGETDDASLGALPAPTPDTVAEQLGSVLIPMLDIGYSMGSGMFVEDAQPTAMVPFFREWLRPIMHGRFDDLFVTRGEGDSMMPTLLDGDLAIVDRAQATIRNQDRIWCLTYGELGMIKRVRKLPDGGYQINSDNPAVTAITAYDGEMHVVGRVIWIGRKV